ncbi:MAG TPA: VWA domain-containing protein [Cytophagales bacterium]|nr:VWA domain-containing protein [Cytophagales bacterium]
MDQKSEDLFSWFSFEWFTPSVLRNFNWGNPQFLYVLLLIPVIFLIRWLLLYRSKTRIGLSVPEEVLRKDFTTILRLIPPLLFFISLCLLVVALARPQKTTERVEQITKGIDIMIVLDISKSMEMQDLKPNRLEAAKKTAKEFILGRHQDRIGIVVFSGEAFSLSPLTTDYDLLTTYVNEIKFNLIEQGGTAIGSALAVGINRLKESRADSKVIILLSDGDNNAGNIDPITAANLASAYGIKIYTILVGLENGSIPIGTDIFGNVQYLDIDVDPKTLRQISEIGNGRFYKAGNNRALKEIFSTIDKLEKSEIKINRYKNIKDFYDIYLKWSLLFFMLWFISKNTFLNNYLQD